ncbi:pyridoxamine 5-phosphate oxidase [Kitasatospora sp. MMS16-BH015]|uniref:pyridoxamine 5'-phosphate oxidase family protein n=1 Tax=Kitasatospora sp. MMS16-BH015 TaxID=2018025 RepID=UPI000CA39975|nr:pyridoxamine 5'-phosphate oxidase family protein [Kitasatospora sp. MMS16-BH015]AUG78611.1 pyridoxamine 5-phosphate oxidase [Kitasatospora sp. MMS16-BH015]
MPTATQAAKAIRTTIPAVAARFLTERRTLVLAAPDPTGRLWITQLSGPAGFLQAPDDHTLTVAARPATVDPLAGGLTGPTEVGTIALDSAGRRRMRVNGLATPTADGGLTITTEQVFANCPKYIQRRTPLDVERPQTPCLVSDTPELTTAQRLFTTTADTFFVATADPLGKADASHRGGLPGFLTSPAPNLLRWPEYPGNQLFMTLGNLELNPAAALLLPDWETGSALHLSGTARTDREGVEFTVERAVEIAHATPLTWTAPEYSPANPPTARY